LTIALERSSFLQKEALLMYRSNPLSPATVARKGAGFPRHRLSMYHVSAMDIRNQTFGLQVEVLGSPGLVLRVQFGRTIRPECCLPLNRVRIRFAIAPLKTCGIVGIILGDRGHEISKKNAEKRSRAFRKEMKAAMRTDRAMPGRVHSLCNAACP
jgi:hypothetical protein